METADLRDSYNLSKFWRLHSPRLRRVLTQGEVRSGVVQESEGCPPLVFRSHCAHKFTATSSRSHVMSQICSPVHGGSQFKVTCGLMVRFQGQLLLA